MSPVAARRAPVTVRIDDAAVVFELSDALDAATGSALIAAAESAVVAVPERVDIDLQQLRSWTEEGAKALVRCREICRDLPGGLHYRTGRGPGRDALLAAYT
jgi:hypothetical protein